MARQAKLQTDYFSGSGAGSSKSQSQSHGKKTKGRFIRQQSDSEEAEGFTGYGSEGSAGMAAIRLSRSPSKVSATAQATTIPKPKTKTETTKPPKASTSRRNLEDEDSDYIRALSPSPKKMTQETSRDAEEDVEDLIGDGAAQVSPERPHLQPSTSNGNGKGKEKEKEQVDSSGEELVLAKTPPWKPIAHAPRKRVPLAPSSRAKIPPVPVPETLTRLKNVKAQTQAKEQIHSIASTSVSAPDRSHQTQRPVPFEFIELGPWSEARKARYPIYDFRTNHQPTRPSSSKLKVPTKTTRTSTSLPKSLPQPLPEIMPDIMEISDEETIEAAEPAPTSTPAKRQRFLGVELPMSQRSGSAQKVSSSQTRLDVSSSSRATTSRSGLPAKKSTRRAFTPISGIESADDDDDDDVPIFRKAKQVNVNKPNHKARVQSESGDDEVPLSRPSKVDKGKGKVKAASPAPASRPPKKRRTRIGSEERNAMLNEIEMDEPKRFKSQSRFRAKKTETAFQRNLRKMKNKRQGIIEIDTESEDEDEDDEDQDGTDTADSAADSRSEDFIEDDGGVVADGVLPHEFSLSSAQTPEWKFKVVFHYFVVLAVRGVDILPLKGDTKEYFMPQVEDLRRKMEGFRDQRVRGQLWPHHFVEALKTHPSLQIASLEFPEEHCVACNRHNFSSRFRIDLRGDNYDRDTFKAITKKTKKAKRKADRKRRPVSRASSQDSDDNDSGKSSSGSDSSSESESGKRDPEFFLGAHCKKRTQLYHEMTHWELHLYYRVRRMYTDVLRAKKKEVPDDSEASSSENDSDDEDQLDKIARWDKRRDRRHHTAKRVKRLISQGNLPAECGDVDNIQAWMDDQGHILNELKWMEDLQESSRRIEFEKSRDE